MQAPLRTILENRLITVGSVNEVSHAYQPDLRASDGYASGSHQ